MEPKREGRGAAGRTDADQPAAISAQTWWGVAKRTAGAFKEDELLDRAAALTYYAVLAMFPALLVAVSVLGLIGPSTADKVLEHVQQLAPGSVRDLLHTVITQARAGGGSGGTLAAVGFLGALWSATAYVGAFIRASNRVYDIHDKRPVWKTMPLRIGLTLLMMLLAMASAVIVVFTGALSERAAQIIGLGKTALAVWSIAKWPVLVLLVTLMIVLLFWAAPNVRGRSFHRSVGRSRWNSRWGLRWISPGSLLAVVLWLALSGAFAAYVANLASYNKAYGAVAGVIVFLLWLWLTNLAILLGLEFDAELAREAGLGTGTSVAQKR
ncbi:MAG: YihY/virulence factor BrkB family protein [Catenulispora sp.]|nr:YihY/virulence factor BrkB family protein [Catenulispora sp.]